MPVVPLGRLSARSERATSCDEGLAATALRGSTLESRRRGRFRIASPLGGAPGAGAAAASSGVTSRPRPTLSDTADTPLSTAAPTASAAATVARETWLPDLAAPVFRT